MYNNKEKEHILQHDCLQPCKSNMRAENKSDFGNNRLSSLQVADFVVTSVPHTFTLSLCLTLNITWPTLKRYLYQYSCCGSCKVSSLSAALVCGLSSLLHNRQHCLPEGLKGLGHNKVQHTVTCVHTHSHTLTQTEVQQQPSDMGPSGAPYCLIHLTP